MGLLDRLLVRGTITEVEQVARRMKRLRIAGDPVRKLRPKPGQQVRLVVGEIFGLDLVRNDAVRTYSIWDHSAEAGFLDLCVLDHESAGPGARFARRAEIGQSAALAGPEGKFVLRSEAREHVFLGEETAQVAFGAMLRAIPRDATVHGVVEVGAHDDALTLPGAHAIEVSLRNGGGVGSALLAAARSVPLSSDTVVYIAGEAKTCKALRRIVIEERKVPRGNVLLKPFWTPGSKGLE